jgi:hypothetical protein
LRKHDGSFTESNDEKCEVLATRLEGVHSTPANPIFYQVWKESVDSFVESNNNLFSVSPEDAFGPCLPVITPAALRLMIIQAKKGSPGEDGITYSLLANCNDSKLLKISTILNQCRSLGYFPKAWKHAKVCMLPKPGKAVSDAAGYRPISLLSCLGKSFERLICDQFVKILDKKHFFSKYQAGFHKGRSTHEHPLPLFQDILNGFKRKECSLAIFLDVASAFDAVWTNGLKLKLHKIGLPKHLLSLLC